MIFNGGVRRMTWYEAIYAVCNMVVRRHVLSAYSIWLVSMGIWKCLNDAWHSYVSIYMYYLWQTNNGEPVLNRETGNLPSWLIPVVWVTILYSLLCVADYYLQENGRAFKLGNQAVIVWWLICACVAQQPSFKTYCGISSYTWCVLSWGNMVVSDGRKCDMPTLPSVLCDGKVEEHWYYYYYS